MTTPLALKIVEVLCFGSTVRKRDSRIAYLRVMHERLQRSKPPTDQLPYVVNVWHAEYPDAPYCHVAVSLSDIGSAILAAQAYFQPRLFAQEFRLAIYDRRLRSYARK